MYVTVHLRTKLPGCDVACILYRKYSHAVLMIVPRDVSRSTTGVRKAEIC